VTNQNAVGHTQPTQEPAANLVTTLFWLVAAAANWLALQPLSSDETRSGEVRFVIWWTLVNWPWEQVGPNMTSISSFRSTSSVANVPFFVVQSTGVYRMLRSPYNISMPSSAVEDRGRTGHVTALPAYMRWTLPQCLLASAVQRRTPRHASVQLTTWE